MRMHRRLSGPNISLLGAVAAGREAFRDALHQARMLAAEGDCKNAIRSLTVGTVGAACDSAEARSLAYDTSKMVAQRCSVVSGSMKGPGRRARRGRR